MTATKSNSHGWLVTTNIKPISTNHFFLKRCRWDLVSLGRRIYEEIIPWNMLRSYHSFCYAVLMHQNHFTYVVISFVIPPVRENQTHRTLTKVNSVICLFQLFPTHLIFPFRPPVLKREPESFNHWVLISMISHNGLTRLFRLHQDIQYILGIPLKMGCVHRIRCLWKEWTGGFRYWG